MLLCLFILFFIYVFYIFCFLALLLLSRAAESYPPAMEYILRKKAVPLIIHTLKAIHSNEVLQLKGLHMLHTLSKTSEGWKQISETRGGWQTICQGSTTGNELVHDLPGEFNNPGWAIGETPHLPLVEREKLAAAQAMQDKRYAKPKAAWTSHSLREYMGITMKAQKLAINNEAHEIYFDLISTLDLLPFPDEQREQWFQRVAAYEKEMQIRLDEMSETVLAIKQKEAQDAKAALMLEHDEDAEVVKPVYVMGNRITMDYLTKADRNVQEQLDGLV